MTHAEKLARIKTLMDSPEIAELNALVEEVAEYERIHFPIAKPAKYTGHVPCRKCGKTHWMHGPCSNNRPVD
jgi:hypothetical protein